MNYKHRKFDMGGLLALLLFAVFAVCILSVLLMGANTYKRLAYSNTAEDSGRTAIQYISTKVRQSDADGMISVGSFDGTTAEQKGNTLILTEEFDNSQYSTRIYCNDGYLCELFGAADGTFTVESGQKILEAESVEFALDESGMLHVSLTDNDGQLKQIDLTIRSGRVVR